MAAALRTVRYLILSIGLMQYALARLPEKHFRQAGDALCFYYAVGNVLQEELMTLDTLQNLDIFFSKETGEKALKYKLIENSKKEEFSIYTLRQVYDSQFLNFMLSYQGYQGGFHDHVPAARTRHIKHYDLVPDTHAGGFLTYYNAHTRTNHHISEDDVKDWFDMPHFKGFIIKQRWDSEWSHYSCIARNGKHWFYIENYYSMMDLIRTEDWDCPAVPKDSNGLPVRGRHAPLPKRDLNPEWVNSDGEYKWNKKECLYSKQAIRYLGSRYLGVDNYNGIHRMKQMIESTIGTAEWFKPVFDATNVGNLIWWMKHFGVRTFDKTAKSSIIAANRNEWPLHALESLRLSYVWCRGTHVAFWNDRGYIYDKTVSSRTCNLRTGKDDPNTWKPGKTFIKRALLAEFNRKLGNCGVRWNDVDFSTWQSGYVHVDD
eukprot:113991_1